jgi:integrase
MLRRGIGKRVIQMTHSVIHGSLVKAEALGLVVRNPSQGLSLPTVKKRKMKFFIEAEVSRFMIAVKGDKNEYFYHLALTTGMRQGELLGLFEKSIDWEHKLLYVRNNVFYSGGVMEFNPPKTPNGMRIIELDDGDIDVLRLQLDKVAEMRSSGFRTWTEYGLVFPSRVGTPQHRTDVGIDFRRICREAGLPAIRFHDLRHTAASLMIAHGEDIFVISRRLGHSTVQITYDYYGHLLPGQQREAARKLNELVRPIRVDQEV